MKQKHTGSDDAQEGLVLSDLHLGRVQTFGPETLIKTEDYIDKHHVGLLVLNGDIIEARELTGNQVSIDHQLSQSVDQVRHLFQHAIKANPNCKIVYVYGNHDCSFELKQKLDALKKEFPQNFQTENSYFKYKDAIFLHGDLPVNMTDVDILSQSSLMGEIKKINKLLSKSLSFQIPTFEDHVGSIERPAIKQREGDHGWFHTAPTKDVGDDAKVLAKATLETRVDSLVQASILPIRSISKVVINSLRAFDKQHPEAKLLPGTKHVVFAHVHPKIGSKINLDGMEMVVTSASTDASSGMPFRFNINGDGVSDFMLLSPDSERASDYHKAMSQAAPQKKLGIKLAVEQASLDMPFVPSRHGVKAVQASGVFVSQG